MTRDPSSRHRDLPTYRVSPEVELYVPRVRTEPPPVGQHLTTRTDRPDLLAAIHLGDPHLFWRIADANPAVPLDELCEPGSTVDIPGPAS